MRTLRGAETFRFAVARAAPATCRHSGFPVRYEACVSPPRCPLLVRKAGARETLLHEVFGADAPLVRIFVYRDLERSPPRLESMLAAEPASGRWVATEPETGPASLRDEEALSCFLWSLLADRTT